MSNRQAETDIVLVAPTSSSSRASIVARAMQGFRGKDIACQRVFLDDEQEMTGWPAPQILLLPADQQTPESLAALNGVVDRHVIVALAADELAAEHPAELQKLMAGPCYDVVTEADINSPTLPARIRLWQKQKAQLAAAPAPAKPAPLRNRRSPSREDGMVEYSFALLDHIVPGVILATAGLRLIHANASGKDFLQSASLLETGADNQLQVKDARITRAIQTLQQEEHSPDAETAAHFDDEGIIMHFSHVGRDASKAGIAIFVCQQNQMIDLDPQRLQKVYGLSNSESRLTLALLNGDTLPDLATEWNLSQNTLRSQLKSVLHKTGAKRQSDLIKIILTGPASLTPKAT